MGAGLADAGLARADIAAIEGALVAAFRAMPGRPFYRIAERLRPAEGDGPAVTILDEAAAVLAKDVPTRDLQGFKYLLGWARCRAWSTSFAEYCAAQGWKRPSAEKGRRRAAAAIALARRRRDGVTAPARTRV